MAGDQSKEDSVFDFLYVDHDRVGLLLSQVSDDGIITELVRQSEASDETGLGFDVKIVKMSAKEAGKESVQQRFNTRWLIPLIFLDRLNERFGDPDYAALGSLVRADGVLSLVHTELLQDLYRSSSVRPVLTKRARANAKQKGETFNEDIAKVEMEALNHLPPQIQMHLFRGEGYRLWATLRPDGLVTPATELAVKHGNLIPGEWVVIGIVDALPYDASSSAETQELLIGRFKGQPFLQEAVQMSDGIRAAYGRAADSLGITPLLIFRELKRSADQVTEEA